MWNLEIPKALKISGITDTVSPERRPQKSAAGDGAICSQIMAPGARFSKLPVITLPVKLFCFPLQMGVSKGLKIAQ